MSNIVMRLQNAQGDELSRLPLSDIQIAPAGGPSASMRPDLSGQMAHLLSQVATMLKQEGLEPAQSTTALKITLARGVVSPPETDGTVTIALPVRAIGSAQDTRPLQAATPARFAHPCAAISTQTPVSEPVKPTLTGISESQDWDDLFEIDSRTQGRAPATRNAGINNAGVITDNSQVTSAVPPASGAPRFVDDFDEDF